jgi:Zn ribbon nucleic-acid-binding protein
MTPIELCAHCGDARRKLRRLVDANERRLRTGRPIDLEGIDALKEDIAECVARGHHDRLAGPNARWHSDARAPA